MKSALSRIAALTLAAFVTAAHANVTETFNISLDPSQIQDITGAEAWVVGLAPDSGLLIPGDRYTAQLRFNAPQQLSLTDVESVYLYIDDPNGYYEFSVNVLVTVYGSNGFTLSGSGDSTNGVLEGELPLSPHIASCTVSGLDVRFDIEQGMPEFGELDVGLIAGSISLVPEPASILLLPFALLLYRRPKLR